MDSTGGGKGGFWRWDSPVPYLFGGLAAMTTLITVALIILACSYRKSVARSQDEEQKPVAVIDDFQPKIVVIMAGDHNPSFFAKPNPL